MIDDFRIYSSGKALRAKLNTISMLRIIIKG